MFLVILLVLSLIGIAVSLFAEGMLDFILIAGPSAIACTLLLLIEWLRKSKKSRPKPNWIVIDGSNVMYWKDGTPQIETVQEVVREISQLGFTPCIVFDANAGHLLSGQYRHDSHFSNLLKLPNNRVMVVPKGSPADPFILTAARDFDTRILTNDRFRDWQDEYPKIREPGYLVKGGYKKGKLWLGVGHRVQKHSQN